MSVILLAETNNGELAQDITAKAATAAAQLGEVTMLVCGTSAAADEAAKIAGISKVLLCDDSSVQNGLAENVAQLIVDHAGGVSHIVAPATNSGKNILPRVAALLDVMVITDVVEVVDGETFKRPIYAGNAIQTVKSTDAIKVLCVRSTTFEAAASDNSASVEAISAPADSGLSAHIEDKVIESERPELTSAKIVVSGGRALGSKENFALIEQLADKLEAAIGASRAAVDAGYAPNDFQVGQTGKVVAPELYLAVGISGAIQHLAGMKESKIIVAINKDEEAPIFRVADYGLVADLFDVVPELIESL